MSHNALRVRPLAALMASIGVTLIAVFAVLGSTASIAAAASSTSSCGPKPGVKATGTPIPVGAINTKQPGTDFSDIENMEGAYFACVNANGGVNGHPIKLYPDTEATSPSQAAADAKQLVQNDHVVAVSGSSSLIECSVNQKYWAQHGFNVIGAGIAPECYSTPNEADANMGPRYSSDIAEQYVIGLPGVNKVVFDQSNVPGTGYNAGGIPLIAKTKHLPSKLETDNVPIQNGDVVAERLVQDAGSNGVIVLNFTPPEALIILQAAQKLNLENRVKAWACSTPCDTDFLASSLGSAWDNKFFVNAELDPPDADTSATMTLYKNILSQYGKNVSGGIGSFSEMGFIDGEILVHALNSVHGAYTVKSVNAAIKAVKNFKTGMLCEPWTYGNYPLHIANNTDWTVTPNNGKMVIKQGCTQISSADPDANKYYKALGVKVAADPKPLGPPTIASAKG
jgi:branched-chain amino acid transport system substrate-binding protein